MKFMEVVKMTDQDAIYKACDVLRAGGVVMHPTETCYGLAVDIAQREAVLKLYELKGRDADKPVSVLVDSLQMAMNYGVFSAVARRLAEQYWPGPLSIVVPRKPFLPAFLNPGVEFVSLRFSSDPFCRGLLGQFGAGVTTTSANLSGEDPYYAVDLQRITRGLAALDLVVDGGVLVENKPSTIVKVVGRELMVLRQGAIVI